MLFKLSIGLQIILNENIVLLLGGFVIKYNYMQKGISTLESILFVLFLLVTSGIVFIILNPIINVSPDPNDQAWADVLAISNAIQVNKIDYQGQLLPTIRDLDINRAYFATLDGGGDGFSDCTETLSGMVNLTQLVAGGYLSGQNLMSAGYYLKKSGDDKVTVGSCQVGEGERIEVTR
ncbi:hypothetical protein COT97_04245 [Candidatus Falkowbacteria bacterium CG10_big_fil_rev_8_21_14_0_10_39_11]|uniref:Uncharacterized protein n=1 Tax=Candidatus Falkowbacteria bacterium CG10_big_fil_rev_8_21_14_0_10_39_11 TaxID=1974565 RepID=A0A2H0V478_9BACT|nr:MAG: hypothetical protein COT97_04245 [Candidatus Falkowbacteria bacterium CG10_big_fil_rev_8_21_14_0_10_39_11]